MPVNENSLSSIFTLTGKQCNAKWKNLRDSLCEAQTREKSSKSGDPAKTQFKWKYPFIEWTYGYGPSFFFFYLFFSITGYSPTAFITPSSPYAMFHFIKMKKWDFGEHIRVSSNRVYRRAKIATQKTRVRKP